MIRMITIIATLVFCVSTPLYAGVYKSTNKETGVVEYRDAPCRTSHSSETEFLPIPYNKTNNKSQNIQERELKQEERKLQQTDRDITKEQKRALREKRQAEKQTLLMQAKEQRRQVRCERLQERIELIEAQLREGCKLKKTKRLEAQLEQARLMKRRYCIADPT